MLGTLLFGSGDVIRQLDIDVLFYCSTSYSLKHGGEDWLNPQFITKREYLLVFRLEVLAL